MRALSAPTLPTLSSKPSPQEPHTTLPTTSVHDEAVRSVTAALPALQEVRAEAAITNGRLAEYVRIQMAKEHEHWWKVLRELRDSDEMNDKKFYLEQFNKLQVKTLPTSLSDEEGNVLAPVPIVVVKRHEEPKVIDV